MAFEEVGGGGTAAGTRLYVVAGTGARASLSRSDASADFQQAASWLLGAPPEWLFGGLAETLRGR